MIYMIHAVPSRMWYVQKYLVAEMTKQGIDPNNILLYVDKNYDGNLVSCLNSFDMVPEDDEGIWHMQDDVIISDNFAEYTENIDKVGPKDKLVCGMCMGIEEEDKKKSGLVNAEDMWYSFQCIYIPNHIAHEFVNWFNTDAINEPQFRMWLRKNKFDDSFFNIFISENYHDHYIINVKPNLVDHIDYLLDGSIINHNYPGERRAKYFEDIHLIKELESKLKPKLLSDKLKSQMNKLKPTGKPTIDIEKYNTGNTKKKRRKPMNYCRYEIF